MNEQHFEEKKNLTDHNIRNWFQYERTGADTE